MNTDLPPYTLALSRRRRSIAIVIDPERGVVVYAPHGIGERVLADILMQRRDWINKKLAKVQARRAEPKAHFDGDLNDASRIINERVTVYSELMQLFPKKVAVKDQRRRWGSCSARTGALNLNWRIVMAPPQVVDYVVVHELSHIKHPNHSPAFWSLVAQFVPDYKARRKWLRQHGDRLVV
jgi:predicted metal-dependent hydrolase